MRFHTRWLRGIRLDEDWILVLLALAAVVITSCVVGVAAWSAHERDGTLADAAATAGRLNGGIDDQLYQDLTSAQENQVKLFRAHVETAGTHTGQVKGLDPQADLAKVEADLGKIANRPGVSSEVQSDVTLIIRELSRYTALQATAQANNQQGLPVGAAYLREASGYLTGHTLPSADDIRKADQDQIAKDDTTAGAAPVAPAITCGLGLAGLAFVQVMMARYTRRTLNAGLVVATVLTVAVTAWSLTALSVSGYKIVDQAAPRARALEHLAKARVEARKAHTYDLLTQADHNEDCKTSTSEVTCFNETQVLKSLKPPKGDLRKALTDAKGADPSTATLVKDALTASGTWSTDERDLPTLQNLAGRGQQAEGLATDDTTFRHDLEPYTDPAKGDAKYKAVTEDFNGVRRALDEAIRKDWKLYEDSANNAGDALTGLVSGLLVLGLLAGAAGAGGVGRRVAEYWSAGRRGV